VSVTVTPPLLDAESREWLHDLRADGAAADEAAARLHALLLRAARFEVTRRSHGLHIRDTDDVAVEAAADALHSVRARLDDYRGDSRFTTWAYKFAVLETAVKLRRRAWQGRELPTASAAMELFADTSLEPAAALEQRELLNALRDGIARLTPHQRGVLVALALNGVPIDVLADRLGSTRGALYKTLHDARKSLQRHVAAAGLS
jgi:RNA polymerase sigma-70 factor (ECF subfamily)